MEAPGTVERSYQLARSGKFRTIGEIETALIRERYTGVREHLSGTLIRKEFRAILRAARLPAEPA
jgi:hypothetical protein